MLVVAPIITRINAPSKNVGILSFVIFPRAKNDKIPTAKPRTPKTPATYALVSSYIFAPTMIPAIIATRTPIRNIQLPNFFNNSSVSHPSLFFLFALIHTILIFKSFM